MKRLIRQDPAFAAVRAAGRSAPRCAQDIKERTLKFAPQNPKGHPLEHGHGEVRRDSWPPSRAARSRSTCSPAACSAATLPDVSAMQGGTRRDGGDELRHPGQQAKEFAVYDFPFLFANAKEADAVVDGPFGQKLHAKLADKGLVGLAYWELGFRNITNSKRPINKVEDIEGLKLRVIPNADQRRLGQGAGRQPDAAGLPRGLRRAGAEGHRRPGEPVSA